MSRLKLVLGLFLVVLIGSACEPITVSLTPTPPAYQQITLAQTFTGTDLFGGTVSVAYPQGWVQGGDANNVLLGTSETIVQTPDTDMSASDSGISITFIPASVAGLSVDIGATPSPYNILINFVKLSRNQPLTFSPIELLTLNNKPTAMTTASTESDSTAVMVVDVGTGYALIVGVADLGNLREFLPTMQAIAGGVSYTR